MQLLSYFSIYFHSNGESQASLFFFVFYFSLDANYTFSKGFKRVLRKSWSSSCGKIILEYLCYGNKSTAKLLHHSLTNRKGKSLKTFCGILSWGINGKAGKTEAGKSCRTSAANKKIKKLAVAKEIAGKNMWGGKNSSKTRANPFMWVFTN